MIGLCSNKLAPIPVPCTLLEPVFFTMSSKIFDSKSTSYSFCLANREDFKKQKILDEARKAGKAPALRDEEGHVINPHIPEYIVKAPCKFQFFV